MAEKEDVMVEDDDSTLTKRKLVLKIAEAVHQNQSDVMDVIQMALDLITQALGEGKNVEFRNFGVFEVLTRKSRVGRNPNRPENPVTIPARTVVKFKPGKEMKQLVLKLNLPSEG